MAGMQQAVACSAKQASATSRAGSIPCGAPDSALGSMSRQRMTVSTWRRPRSGFQSRLSTLTQISPEADTLGWKILVEK